MTCSHCPNPKVFSRSLCSGCYWRLRRNGTLERKHVSNTGTCSISGCEARAFAKGMCPLHYQRERQSSLRSIWVSLRSRSPGSYPPAWDRFDAFAVDVGERPTPKHQLRRVDPDRPWSIRNLVWRKPIGLRANDPEYKRRWHIRDKYGLEGDAEKQMFDRQHGLCATCRLKLGRPHHKTGKPTKICIDHDHKTNRVRGLLCDPCNKGLGAFNDDPETLRRAAAYLEMRDDEEQSI